MRSEPEAAQLADEQRVYHAEGCAAAPAPTPGPQDVAADVLTAPESSSRSLAVALAERPFCGERQKLGLDYDPGEWDQEAGSNDKYFKEGEKRSSCW